MAPEGFNSTLNELKSFLKFNFSFNKKNVSNSLESNFDGFICHEENLNQSGTKEILRNHECFKILMTKSKKSSSDAFDSIIKLPTSLKEINNVIESTAAKKKFNKNSSIEIKSYLLNKNEKKLSKKENFIVLTEKEIQLLELLLKKKKPISKNEILKRVWEYSPEVDTHTVETHIYRLRKKISEKFLDEGFILNNKSGYHL